MAQTTLDASFGPVIVVAASQMPLRISIHQIRPK
jgi:hypothetical protein